MTLEQQVCSLELAKRLKELGVKQMSQFRWSDEPNGGLKTFANKWRVAFRPNPFPSDYENYSAFTVAELGEILPRYIVEKGISYEMKIVRSSVWRIYYGESIYLTAGPDDAEADARAKMLIYLLENKLITV